MTNQTAPAAHRDNLLGICHSIGETFGFNPLYLRLALLMTVMIKPEETLLFYCTAGVAVLIANLTTRRSRKQARELELMNV